MTSCRSLVLGPTDEVDATITLSALSRQAEAFQLAERTLLDPLARMRCSLNSPIFGVGIPQSLGLGLAMIQGESMERIVNGDISVQMTYRAHHQQFSQQLFKEAGGEERYVVAAVLRYKRTLILTSSFATPDSLSSTSSISHTSSIYGQQTGETKR